MSRKRFSLLRRKKQLSPSFRFSLWFDHEDDVLLLDWFSFRATACLFFVQLASMANPLAAALGPVGALTGCACCLLLAAIWGLFATTIALAVYTSKTLSLSAFRSIALFLSSRTMERCHSKGERTIKWSWTIVLQSTLSDWNPLPLRLLGRSSWPARRSVNRTDSPIRHRIQQWYHNKRNTALFIFSPPTLWFQWWWWWWCAVFWNFSSLQNILLEIRVKENVFVFSFGQVERRTYRSLRMACQLMIVSVLPNVFLLWAEHNVPPPSHAKCTGSFSNLHPLVNDIHQYLPLPLLREMKTKNRFNQQIFHWSDNWICQSRHSFVRSFGRRLSTRHSTRFNRSFALGRWRLIKSVICGAWLNRCVLKSVETHNLHHHHCVCVLRRQRERIMPVCMYVSMVNALLVCVDEHKDRLSDCVR